MRPVDAGLLGTTEALDDSDPELAGVSSRVDCVVAVSGDADLTVPLLIIHGNRDEEVPVEMARNLAAALATAGREYVFAEVPAGHLDIANVEANGELMKTFLAYQLHPEE